MNPIDSAIVVVFLLGTALYGIWQGRRNKTTSDYFLGGRNLPWIAAMFSVVATETSVLTFISVPGLAYQKDWYFLQIAVGFILGRVLVSLFLLPSYFKTPITSIYEVLGTRFGTGMQKTASGVFLVTRVLADGVRFLATAVIVQVITGWSISFSVLIIGLVTLVYTLLGGIRTIVWVDSFQFILYLSGGLLTIAYILVQSDVSLIDLFTNLFQEGKFNILRLDLGSVGHDPWFVGNALFGGILLSFASHGADYMMVQRVLGTRNLQAARKAIVGSGLFVFIQFTIFLLAGSLIYSFLQGMSLPKDRELSTFIVNYLPVGLKGILLAGVLSAAMSTLSSSINSLASSTIIDWFRGSSLRMSRMVSLIWAFVLIGIALLFDEGDTAIIELGYQIASFTYGGLLGLFLLSRSRYEFHSLSLGVGLVSSMVFVFILKQQGIPWTWFIGLSVLTNVLLTAITERLLRGTHV
ncbi:MAG: sodium:solute symporter [Fidelibacterota bacterium]